MQTFNMAGARLTPIAFINIYREARKIAPPRFLTLRMHPTKYKELYALADIPESIQLGPTPGPLGKTVMRVCCVKAPMGVADGISVVQDVEADPTKIYVEIHGQLELEVVNLYDSSPKSSNGPDKPKETIN